MILVLEKNKTVLTPAGVKTMDKKLWELPSEILLCCLSDLTVKDLMSLNVTCHFFHNLTLDKFLWKNLIQKNLGFTMHDDIHPFLYRYLLKLKWEKSDCLSYGYSCLITGNKLFTEGENSFVQCAFRNGCCDVDHIISNFNIREYPKNPLQVSCGGIHAAAITDKECITWGSDIGNRLGRKSTYNMGSIKLPSRPLQVSCGLRNSAVITEDGLYIWGTKYGKLQKYDLPDKPLQVSCGSNFVGVITDGGLYIIPPTPPMLKVNFPFYKKTKRIPKPLKVTFQPRILEKETRCYCITDLGIYELEENMDLNLIFDHPRAFQISQGENHTAVLTEEGLYMWGLNYNGEIDGKASLVAYSPHKVSYSQDIRQIFCGKGCTLAITDSTIQIWGNHPLSGKLRLLEELKEKISS